MSVVVDMGHPSNFMSTPEDARVLPVRRALPEEAATPNEFALPEEAVQRLRQECKRKGVAPDRLSLALKVCRELLACTVYRKGHQASDKCKTYVQVFGADPNGQTMDMSEWLNTKLEEGTALGPCIYKPIYDALPPALKQCYLTFAAYPEGESVPGEELAQMWAALAEEPVPGCEEAEGHLAQLVARGLVLRDDEKGYYMHYVLRILAVHEARKPRMRCHYEVDNDRRLFPDASVAERKVRSLPSFCWCMRLTMNVLPSCPSTWWL